MADSTDELLKQNAYLRNLEAKLSELCRRRRNLFQEEGEVEAEINEINKQIAKLEARRG